MLAILIPTKKKGIHQMNSLCENTVFILKTLKIFIKCPYYKFNINILVNKLNNISIEFDFAIRLRGKVQYSYQTNCEFFSIVHESLNLLWRFMIDLCHNVIVSSIIFGV